MDFDFFFCFLTWIKLGAIGEYWADFFALFKRILTAAEENNIWGVKMIAESLFGRLVLCPGCTKLWVWDDDKELGRNDELSERKSMRTGHPWSQGEMFPGEGSNPLLIVPVKWRQNIHLAMWRLLAMIIREVFMGFGSKNQDRVHSG